MILVACSSGMMPCTLLPDPSSSRRVPAKPRVAPERVQAFVTEVLTEDVHARRAASVSNGVLGVLHAAALGVNAIGRGLAVAQGLDPKHAIKQVDRLLSNAGFTMWDWFPSWIAFAVGARKQIVVALDWTHFDADGHATIALNLITSHGRATALVWKTVEASKLKDRQSEYERDLLALLHDSLPNDIDITVLADRGFGDQKLYEYLETLGWRFVIRFRECILVTTDDGITLPAAERVPVTGHAKMLRNVRVTRDKAAVPAVVLKHQKGMKEAWCLATNRVDLGAGGVVDLYARRFTIEETFRDLKDPRFGTGLLQTRVGRTDRRDRLIFLFALAHALLTLLGAAGEAAGLDRTLKANTSKRRTLSLFNQGLFWWMAIPNMREERLVPLMDAFAKTVRDHAAFSTIFGVI
jgi:hypothetical protein